ncbi:structure-specific endonuclease subunit SLX4 [Sardina pilchardus]|uniref:structure-specific endonuclease subunit SLX4 n=1 Tax=Sardina pilchardus TaxID=27697 RepID=UPI002E0E0875
MQRFKRVDPQKLQHADSLPSTVAEPACIRPPSPPVQKEELSEDEKLAVRLQKELDNEFEGQAQGKVVDVDQGGLFFCQLCFRDLSAMSPQLRTQHINRCLDESESQAAPSAAPAAPRPVVPECPICGKVFKSLKSRSTHLKRCSSEMGVPPAVLLQAVQRQASEAVSDSTAGQSVQAGGPKRRLPSDPTQPARKRPKKAAQPVDEDTMVALALSRSLLDQEAEMERAKAIEVVEVKGAEPQTSVGATLQWKPAAAAGKGRRRRKGAPSGPPPLLLRQDPEEALRRLQERVSLMLLRSRTPSPPPTPTLHPSTLLPPPRRYRRGLAAEEEESPDPCSPAPLWHKSALPAGYGHATEEFYTVELSAFIQPYASPQRDQSSSTMTPPVKVQPAPPSLPPAAAAAPTAQAPARSPSPSSPAPSPLLPTQAVQDLLALGEKGLNLAAAPHQGPSYADAPQQLSGLTNPDSDTRVVEPKNSSSLSRLASDLSSMVNNPQLSDVQLQVDSGEVLFAHSFMLYARCPLLVEQVHASGFGVQEEGMPAAQRVLLGEVPVGAVLAMLQFLYSAQCPLTPSLAPHVQELAVRFDLPELSQECQLYLRRLEQQEEEEGSQAWGGAPAPEPSEGHEEQDNTQAQLHFLELLRSMWSSEDEGEEEEEGQGDGRADGEKSVRMEEQASEGEENGGEEHVDEEELEEIYEFAATQRRGGESALRHETESLEEEEEQEDEEEVKTAEEDIRMFFEMEDEKTSDHGAGEVKEPGGTRVGESVQEETPAEPSGHLDESPHTEGPSSHHKDASGAAMETHDECTSEKDNQDGEPRPDDQDGEPRPNDQDGERHPDDQGGERHPDDQGGERHSDDQGGEPHAEPVPHSDASLNDSFDYLFSQSWGEYAEPSPAPATQRQTRSKPDSVRIIDLSISPPAPTCEPSFPVPGLSPELTITQGSQRPRMSSDMTGTHASQRPRMSSDMTGTHESQRPRMSSDMTDMTGTHESQRPRMSSDMTGTHASQRLRLSSDMTGTHASQRLRLSSDMTGTHESQRLRLSSDMTGTHASQRPRMSSDMTGTRASQRFRMSPELTITQGSQRLRLSSEVTGTQGSQRATVSPEFRVSYASQRLQISPELREKQASRVEALASSNRSQGSFTDQCSKEVELIVLSDSSDDSPTCLSPSPPQPMRIESPLVLLEDSPIYTCIKDVAKAKDSLSASQTAQPLRDPCDSQSASSDTPPKAHPTPSGPESPCAADSPGVQSLLDGSAEVSWLVPSTPHIPNRTQSSSTQTESSMRRTRLFPGFSSSQPSSSSSSSSSVPGHSKAPSPNKISCKEESEEVSVSDQTATSPAQTKLDQTRSNVTGDDSPVFLPPKSLPRRFSSISDLTPCGSHRGASVDKPSSRRVGHPVSSTPLHSESESLMSPHLPSESPFVSRVEKSPHVRESGAAPRGSAPSDGSPESRGHLGFSHLQDVSPSSDQEEACTSKSTGRQKDSREGSNPGSSERRKGGSGHRTSGAEEVDMNGVEDNRETEIKETGMEVEDEDEDELPSQQSFSNYDEPPMPFDEPSMAYDDPPVAFEEQPIACDDQAAAFDEPPMAFDDSWGFGDCRADLHKPRFSLRLESSGDGDGSLSCTTPLGPQAPVTTDRTPPAASPEPQPSTSVLDPKLWDSWEEEEEEGAGAALPLSQRLGAVAPAKRVAQLRTPVASKKAGPLMPITPMPHYSDMDTPDLKNKLNRFGVRPLPKRQMVVKLKEIFQYTHQLESSESEDEAPVHGHRPQPVPAPARSCAQSLNFKEPRAPPAVSPKKVQLSLDAQEPLSLSQSSNASSTDASQDSDRTIKMENHVQTIKMANHVQTIKMVNDIQMIKVANDIQMIKVANDIQMIKVANHMRNPQRLRLSSDMTGTHESQRLRLSSDMTGTHASQRPRMSSDMTGTRASQRFRMSPELTITQGSQRLRLSSEVTGTQGSQRATVSPEFRVSYASQRLQISPELREKQASRVEALASSNRSQGSFTDQCSKEVELIVLSDSSDDSPTCLSPSPPQPMRIESPLVLLEDSPIYTCIKDVAKAKDSLSASQTAQPLRDPCDSQSASSDTPPKAHPTPSGPESPCAADSPGVQSLLDGSAEVSWLVPSTPHIPNRTQSSSTQTESSMRRTRLFPGFSSSQPSSSSSSSSSVPGHSKAPSPNKISCKEESEEVSVSDQTATSPAQTKLDQTRSNVTGDDSPVFLPPKSLPRRFSSISDLTPCGSHRGASVDKPSSRRVGHPVSSTPLHSESESLMSPHLPSESPFVSRVEKSPHVRESGAAPRGSAPSDGSPESRGHLGFSHLQDVSPSSDQEEACTSKSTGRQKDSREGSNPGSSERRKGGSGHRTSGAEEVDMNGVEDNRETEIKETGMEVEDEDEDELPSQQSFSNYDEPPMPFDEPSMAYDDPPVAFEEQPIACDDQAAAFDEPPMAFDDSWGFGDCRADLHKPRFSLRLESSGDGDGSLSCTTPLGPQAPVTTDRTPPAASPEPQPSTSVLDPKLWDSWEEEEEEGAGAALPLSQRLGAVAPAKRVAQLRTPVASKKAGPLMPITPMPHYSDMDTPDLKNKLNRFGVRPLPKRQMVVKLKEIFQYTHQLESSESEDEAPVHGHRPQPVPAPARSCAQSLNFKEPRAPPAVSPKKVQLSLDAQEPLSLSQSSNASSTDASQDSDRSNPELLVSDDGDSSSDSEGPVTASQAVSKHADKLKAVRRFILSDPELHGQVLQYRPLALSQLQERLKAAGIRLAAAKLLDFLDAQCITFTTAKPGQKAPSRRRRKKPTTAAGARGARAAAEGALSLQYITLIHRGLQQIYAVGTPGPRPAAKPNMRILSVQYQAIKPSPSHTLWSDFKF